MRRTELTLPFDFNQKQQCPIVTARSSRGNEIGPRKPSLAVPLRKAIFQGLHDASRGVSKGKVSVMVPPMNQPTSNEEEIKEFFRVIDALAPFTAPALCSIIGVDDVDYGELVGTGTYLR